MIRAAILAFCLCISGVASAWDLGDLSSFSGRLDTDWGSLDDWADGYDTQAELEALGWTVVNVNAVNCAADTTAPKDEDASVFTVGGSYFNSTNCPGGTCNKIFRLQDSCQYDLLAGSGGVNDTTPAVLLAYNNFAIIGGGMNSTYIACNDANSGSTDTIGLCLANGTSWTSNPASTTGSAFTWSSGNTKGTSTITLSSCGTLAVNDPIILTGGNEDGASLRMQNRITGLAGCNVTLADPLPTTFTTISTVQEINSGRTKKNIFLNFHIGFPNITSTVCSSDSASADFCTLIRMHGTEETLFDHVWIGPFPQTGIDQRGNWRTVVRNGIGGEGMTSKTRGTRTGFMTGNPFGSYFQVYNMWLKNNAIRGATLSTDAAAFSFIGWNYWEDMNCGLDERAIFINHDAGFDNNGRWLVEANDMECYVFNEALNVMPRYGTMYRNRSDRDTGNNRWGSANAANYVNFFANRFTGWVGYNGGSGAWSLASLPNSVGRWNVAESGTFPTPGGTGADWGATNQVTTNPNSNCPLDIPASLFFTSDTPPSWMCVESFTSDGNQTTALARWLSGWAFGACDDSGGTIYKTPAQILAEGGTCTPFNEAGIGPPQSIKIQGVGGPGWRF